MKGVTFSLCVLAALGLMTASVLAGNGESAEIRAAAGQATPAAGATDAAPPAAPVDDSNLTEFELMVRELKLTEPLLSQVKEKFQAMEKALADWDKEAAIRVEKIEAAVTGARNAGNSDEVAKLLQQRMDLQGERAKLAEKLMREILALLSPEQQTEWEGFKLYQATANRFKALKLTDDQLVKIRDLCRQGAKAEAEARITDGNVTMIRAKLFKDIRELVLTQEQRDKLGGRTTPSAAPVQTAPPPPKPTPAPVRTDQPKKPDKKKKGG
jgi:Spy/CpxP family protein refolding chaperone